MGIVKKIFFSLLICLIFFVMLEIALRIYLCIKYKKNDYLRLIPGSITRTVDSVEQNIIRISSKVVDCGGYYKFTPGKFGYEGSMYFPFTINSLGFRGEEFQIKKPKDKIRIIAIGGSTTFGTGVNDNQTMPYYLNEVLNNQKINKKFEVINCGFPSYKMENMYSLFTKEVFRYQPDIVIVYEAINDASQLGLVRGDNFIWKLHDRLYYRLMLYTIFIEKYSVWKRGYAIPIYYFYKKKKIPQAYSKYLKAIITFAKEKEIELVLIKMPVNLQDKKIPVNYSLSLEELDNLYKDTKGDIESNTVITFYYIKQMEEIGRENDILVIAPAETIIKKPELFMDRVHLKPKGNRILAELIAKDLFKYIYNKRAFKFLSKDINTIKKDNL